ncbi:uncharacterized protein N7529_011781 [Penicillium soppii]|jgi:hypothetical protein|uniref:uncharacterized protein n=1 Tax=Penicillium soppii TaxID=69789 RepID=UPI00254713B8|nr:uncharacterized protein N7529_011781 [Penicillium soppii]KAJ5852396.1 hypothetical protein N7529_011781 [Penicillium soppii]
MGFAFGRFADPWLMTLFGQNFNSRLHAHELCLGGGWRGSLGLLRLVIISFWERIEKRRKSCTGWADVWRSSDEIGASHKAWISPPAVNRPAGLRHAQSLFRLMGENVKDFDVDLGSGIHLALDFLLRNPKDAD